MKNIVFVILLVIVSVGHLQAQTVSIDTLFAAETDSTLVQTHDSLVVSADSVVTNPDSSFAMQDTIIPDSLVVALDSLSHFDTIAHTEPFMDTLVTDTLIDIPVQISKLDVYTIENTQVEKVHICGTSSKDLNVLNAHVQHIFIEDADIEFVTIGNSFITKITIKNSVIRDFLIDKTVITELIIENSEIIEFGSDQSIIHSQSIY